jgi:hypothetical protein
LDRPSEFPPEIQFPAGLKTDLGLPVVDAADVNGRCRSIAYSIVLNGPDALLRLREEVTDGDPQLSAGLQDPHARRSEREVFPVGLLDEAVQSRIVEGGPPVAIGGRRRAQPWVPGLQPVRRQHGLRPLVVRPDHASGEGQEHRDEEEEPASRPCCAMRQFRGRANLLSGHVTTQDTGSA